MALFYKKLKDGLEGNCQVFTRKGVTSADSPEVVAIGDDIPVEPYDRAKHYGKTPSKSDRKHFGATADEVVDHDPPLVQRYYEGDPETGEIPGFKMTPQQRKASGQDRTRMKNQPRSDSNAQGGKMSKYSKGQKEKWGLDSKK